MKRLFISLLALGLCLVQARAQRHYLLDETFRNLTGDGTGDIVPAQLDHPEGWTFTGAYAHDGAVIIRKGGSVTTPPLSELTGNATVDFRVEPWREDGREDFDDPYSNPLRLSVSGGELSHTQLDPFSTMAQCPHIYGVDAASRVTLTATYDIRLTGISIYYANEAELTDGSLTTFSHEPGDYFAPFDLELAVSKGSTATWGDTDTNEADSRHNILVYTLDGSVPTRRSARYDGTPLRIAGTTTVTTGTIFGNGSFVYEKPRTYSFPVAEQPAPPENIFEVNVTEPGSLAGRILDIDADLIEALRIRGSLNSADLACLAAGEGRTAVLTYLDLSAATLSYDGGRYATVVDAPEAGMGTTYVYDYYLSPDNRDERAGSSPTTVRTDCYRNNLAGLFRRHRTLQTVILPDVLKNIGEYFLASCATLRTVVMPQDVKAVGTQAFYNCTGLRLYDFPATLEEVGAGAFAYTRLGRVAFDRRVRIGGGAFQGSTMAILDMPLPPDTIPAYAFDAALTEVRLGEGLRYIGEHAFGGDIATASLPASLRELSSTAFPADCPFIRNIEPEGGIRYIGAVAYAVTDPGLAEYTLRPGTVSLADGLFAGSAATAFHLPASLEAVGAEAFRGTSLTTLPAMPALRRIGAGAFRGCQRLARIEIPETVERIGDAAFYECPALWSVTYNAADAACSRSMFDRSIGRIILGDRVRRLPAGLFTGNDGLTEVTLPQSVETIDAAAFYNCVNLRSVRLPEGVTAIGDEAFAHCRALASLHWPLRLTSVGYHAFFDCEALTTVSLPEGVERVGECAFYGCRGLERLYIASTVRTIGEGAFELFNGDRSGFTVTCAAAEPPAYYWSSGNAPAVVKVPAGALEKYRADGNWRGAGNTFTAIGSLAPPAEGSETSFGTGLDENADLADTVVGDVYLTLGAADGYDPSDGSIVLAAAMSGEQADAAGGLAPGHSDLHNRFDGLVVQAGRGEGILTVDCRTAGTLRLAVKTGTGRPQTFVQDIRGRVEVRYSVPEDTYIYLYAAADAQPQPSAPRRAGAPATDNCVKIYAVALARTGTGIADLPAAAGGEAPVTACYTLDGRRVAAPVARGTYIVLRADGSRAKVVVR